MTFFGACSGDVFGNVTVSTPFSIDALISSAYTNPSLASHLICLFSPEILTLMP